MGREIYHGDPKGTDAQTAAFNEGVRIGAFGLLLNSVIYFNYFPDALTSVPASTVLVAEHQVFLFVLHRLF
jgi:hypothetical protein